MSTQELTGRGQLAAILEHPTYKQILNDSFGGVMYDLSNKPTYNSTEILKLWDELDPIYKESSGGITKGLFNFLLTD